ncbi:MAG: hypothetical protein J6Z43_07195 [Clostridiales bacterium]|nr:hypothetical protein [Clostridiales bacterium]
MSKFKRVWYVISGLQVILFAFFIMLLDTNTAFVIITFIIGSLLILKGLQYLIFYLTMAHHMVGGKVMLLGGVILLDLGVFAASLVNEAKVIIIIYLISGHLLAGGIDIVRAVRSKKEGFSWKSDMATGIGNLLVALSCIVFIGSPDILILVYCLGLMYSACVRIIRAFKKSAVVYIA